MKHQLYLLLLLLLLISDFLEPIHGQCAGGIWSIQQSNIGSFSVSWRYNMASNTVQFIIEGKATDSINLSTTYIALGWSDTAPTMTKMDVAMFFPGTQIVQDRFSQGHSAPTLDNQQDFCVIRTNTTDKNIYAAFERFLATGDTKDISFTSDVYLMFAVGSYTFTNGYNPQQHSFRTSYQTSISLLSCSSSGCSTTSCPIAACPCLQQITTGSGQCVCFPPSSCVSGSTVTPRISTTISVAGGISSVGTSLTGSCQNQTNPCTSNGICIQLSATQYMCQCKNNYTGVYCQTPLGDNNTGLSNSCQCLNSGTCLTNGSCLCSNLFRGKFCQINNPCNNYCQYNGNCSVVCTDTACNRPVCSCGNDSTGAQCETSVSGPCQASTCINGNCVTLSNGTMQCQCNYGYFGSRCNLVNSCLSSPCNQGTCVPSSTCQGLLCSYACLCPTGVTGSNCENNNNPCQSNPCQNNGTCLSSSNKFSCRCQLPYGGTLCELTINVCTPNPCFNNGECVRSTNIQDGTYRCNCPTGFIGTSCEYISGCISSPCRNGGQCISSTTNCSSTTCPATCKCVIGTSGIFCEQLSLSCSTQPCLNGGICLTNSTTNISYCQCLSNTTGVRCETIVPLCTASTCANNGVCYVDASGGNNVLRCICASGYTGADCQIARNTLGSCASNPCGYNGTCFAITNASYYCVCSNGAVGSSCSSTAITSCDNSPCYYLATCQAVSNSNPKTYECICPDYLTGDRCQYVNSCQKQPCYNQGTCIPLGPQNNFMCVCQRGFGQYDCSTYLGLTCNSSVCLNGGTCDSNSTSIRCICPASFAGARCEWTSVCSITTCSNGGTCRQIAATMAECLCPLGFTGPTCGLRDSCANSPCKNGAACTTLLGETSNNWSMYRCNCPPQRYGELCDTPISSCANMLCPSFKICSEQSTGPVCTCTGNKVGTFCQYENPCTLSTSTAYCQNGGTCISSNTDPPVATCLCRTGYTGSRCNTILQNDPCGSTPCLNHGYCALSMVNTTFACICNANYTGSQCERSNPCQSSPCLNSAVCQSQWNTTNTWYTCRCLETFTGTRCETSLLNPCGGLCMNGSPCVDGVCVCSSQYIGTYCGYANPCQSSICRNGGLCASSYNMTSASFSCTCPPLYTGQYCENYLTTQTADCTLPCYNGATCQNGICTCTSQYVGPSCQYENPCVKNNPCLNSATCFGRYYLNGTLYTQCFCLQGYTGANCETPICSLTSCNSGNCTAVQNSFVCTCPSGKSGDQCQYTNACVSNPCSATEQCEQNGNSYKCVSCYDKSTFCSIYQTNREYCSNLYALSVDNSSYSVLEMCPRSCGQCESTQKSNEQNTDIVVPSNDTDSSDSTTTTTTTTTSSSTTTTFGLNIIFSRADKCVDRRHDCAEQKVLGFCEIWNAKYPDDCMNTCHPACNTHI
ncbi:unnamed protein product [Adineta ricciae]|uniref:Uncharacterized protein n=1 Tax=Adineta ricciae TaxID=249248 RepID=A0A815IV92_ADIRI|nr:unnamed protein product [Adineta ricciae]CAF1370891.1 unnamed protein product [Adineta ricciae]